MTEESILFRAVHRGKAATIAHATDAELACLAGAVADAPASDKLDSWSLVAIRGLSGRGTEVHALGWRVQLENTWITSALRVVDLAASVVSTSSGHAYVLGDRDDGKLSPVLRAHLAYALRTWGFEDVRG